MPYGTKGPCMCGASDCPECTDPPGVFVEISQRARDMQRAEEQVTELFADADLHVLRTEFRRLAILATHDPESCIENFRDWLNDEGVDLVK